MVTLELLKKTKDHLRNSILENMEEGIEQLLEVMKEESDSKETVYQYKGEYNELEENSRQGVLEYEKKMLYSSRIRIGLLDIIEELQINDLSSENDLFSTQDKVLIKASVPQTDDTPSDQSIVENEHEIVSAVSKSMKISSVKQITFGASFIVALLLGYFLGIASFCIFLGGALLVLKRLNKMESKK